MQGRRALGWSGGGVLMAALAAACSSHVPFAQLSYDARHVPVPAGVTPEGEQRAVNDGPGFTTSKARQVTRKFSTSVVCPSLEREWEAALRRGGRRFHVDAEPHLFGANGLEEIVLDDRSEHLGITLGSINGDGTWISCNAPFVWSFEGPT